MFFKLLGRFVCRAWHVLLIAWVAVLIGTHLAAPPWGEFAQDQEFAFLPAGAPSRRAEELYAKAFPEDQASSNIVLVLHYTGSDPADPGRDLEFIDDVLEPALRQLAAAEGGLAGEVEPSDEPLFGDEPAKPAPPKKRSIIARIRTPNAPGSGALLVSPDGRAMLVVLELTTDFTSNVNWPTITRVEDLVKHLQSEGKAPPGVQIDLTGSAVIGRDHTLAQVRSARSTETLTVIMVIGLLVLIYRAPLLALVPLATVYLTVRLALNLLAILAGAGFITLFAGLEIYVTILGYGAGVDYCLFLTARFREELDRDGNPCNATERAIAGTGSALVASAATVACGIAMMGFAQFGKFREAGVAIPLSLVLALIASLTFSPSILRLAGWWAFWPQRLGTVLAQDRAAEPGGRRGFFLGGLLRRIWDDVGHALVRRPATFWSITVAAMAPFAIVAGVLHNRLSYDLIGDLPADAPSVAGTRALHEHFPAGMTGPVTVLVVNRGMDFDTPQGRDLVARLTDRLRQQKDDLGLADVRSLTAPLGIAHVSTDAFAGSELPEDVRRAASEEGARRYYLTSLGERHRIGTRMVLILAHSPFSRQGIDALARIDEALRDALPDGATRGTEFSFLGTTASVRDLADIMRQDRRRIELLVLASVFVILVLLLRGLLVPVYLLLSVLFSYFATLGVTFLVFWLLDPQGFSGIDWKVAIFLFTILIAVGEDYNIFLMTRVHEEQRLHGPVAGITAALTRTGPIISSCGIIMAGTFASLLAGSLAEMKQLGFALAFGVLLDTFVVRPILVPAFLILLASGRLAPSAWMPRFPGRRS
jgi:RND superfamily putative drug exporter